jgi:hypothetical protein
MNVQLPCLMARFRGVTVAGPRLRWPAAPRIARLSRDALRECASGSTSVDNGAFGLENHRAKEIDEIHTEFGLSPGEKA